MLIAAGFVSQRALTDELNRRGIATARGGNWHRTTVVRMLTRLGLITLGKGRTDNRLAHKRAADARAKALAPTIRALQGKGPSGVLYAAGWHSRSTSVHRHEWATLPLSPLAHRIWLMDLRMGILFVATCARFGQDRWCRTDYSSRLSELSTGSFLEMVAWGAVAPLTVLVLGVVTYQVIKHFRQH